MSRFQSDLELRLLEYSDGRPVVRSGRCLWRLSEPLACFRRGAPLIVPPFRKTGWTDAMLAELALGLRKVRGVTDLASIPRLGRRVVSPDGPFVKGAIPHDDGYATKGHSYVPILGRPATRKEVDDDLLEDMRDLGVSVAQQNLVYWAVRGGGWRGWGS